MLNNLKEKKLCSSLFSLAPNTILVLYFVKIEFFVIFEFDLY